MLDARFWEVQRQLLFRILFPILIGIYLESARGAMLEIGVAVDWALVNEAARAWARAYTYRLVGGITDTSAKYLQGVVSDWIASGAPLKDLIETIAGSGMFGPVRAEMIAVTEVTRAIAEANRDTWKQSGVTSGLRWNTVSDELVCPICGDSENGKGLSQIETGVDGGFIHPVSGQVYEIPPAHPRCRCWLTPVVTKG